MSLLYHALPAEASSLLRTGVCSASTLPLMISVLIKRKSAVHIRTAFRCMLNGIQVHAEKLSGACRKAFRCVLNGIQVRAEKLSGACRTAVTCMPNSCRRGFPQDTYRKYVFIRPFPFTSISCSLYWKRREVCAFVASVTWILMGMPVLSIRLATLTVSPQIS